MITTTKRSKVFAYLTLSKGACTPNYYFFEFYAGVRFILYRKMMPPKEKLYFEIIDEL